MPQNGEEHFIREKIKDKPINKKKLLQKGIVTAGLAILFGFVSCLVFCALKPYMEQWFEPEPDQIEIPRDTKTDTLADIDATEDASVADDGEKEQKNETVYITETKSMDLSDYQMLENKLYQIGLRANRSIVTVTGITEGTDIFDDHYETTGQSCGFLVGENGKELLILADYSMVKEASSIRVTFGNNDTAKAKLKSYDGNTGIAMLSVKQAKLSEQTLGYVELAALGNSLNVTQGRLAVAIGSPLGANHSVLTGIVTSVNTEWTAADANYKIFTTDMITNGKGTGALLNTDGEIIGLILQADGLQKGANTLSALSISELKDIIEKLSNGETIPYIGIHGSTVTEELSQEYELPKGIYIKEVLTDSPAMKAGLQNGDVIVAIAGTEVTTMEEYREALLALPPGEETRITAKRQNGDEYKKFSCKVEVSNL